MVANLKVEKWQALHQQLCAIVQRRAMLDAEEARVRAAGFEGIMLGPRVMRTETAALAALAAIHARWGDF